MGHHNTYLRHHSDDFSQDTQLPSRDLSYHNWSIGNHRGFVTRFKVEKPITSRFV